MRHLRLYYQLSFLFILLCTSITLSSQDQKVLNGTSDSIEFMQKFNDLATYKLSGQFQELIEQSEKIVDASKPYDSLYYYSRLIHDMGSAYQNMNRTEEAISLLEEGLDYIQKNEDKRKIRAEVILLNRLTEIVGNYDFIKAQSYGQRAINLYANRKPDQDLVDSYNSLAYVYYSSGLLSESVSTLNEIAELPSPPLNDYYRGLVKFNSGVIYNRSNKEDLYVQSLKEALEAYKKSDFSQAPYAVLNALISLARLDLQNGRMTSFQRYFDEIEPRMDTLNADRHEVLASFFDLKLRYCKKRGNEICYDSLMNTIPTNMIHFYEEPIYSAANYALANGKDKTFKKYLSIYKNKIVNNSANYGAQGAFIGYHRLSAKYANRNGDFKKAFSHVDSVLVTLVDNYDSNNLESLNNLDVYTDHHIEMLYLKGRIHHERYYASKAISDLESAIVYYDIMTNVILDVIRDNTFNTGVNEYLGYLKPASQAYLLKFQNSKDKKDLLSHLSLKEKSEFLLVLDNLRKNYAQGELNENLSKLLQAESNTDNQISLAESQLQKKDLSSDNVQIYTKYRDSLMQVKTNIKQTVSSDFPDYYKLRYGDISLDWSMLENMVDDSTVLISYLAIDDHLSVLYYSRDTVFAVDHTLPPKYFNDLSSSFSVTGFDESNKAFRDLYSYIVEPVESLKPNMLFYPSADLPLVPFEVLKDSDGYLMDKYGISYINSIFQLHYLRDSKSNSKGIFAYAYSPDDVNEDLLFATNFTRGDFDPLVGVFKELDYIADYFDGAFIKSPLEKSELIDLMKQYQIVHFASHFKVDSENPRYSFLQINNDSLEGQLFVDDILLEDLGFDLAVFSACETGLGKYDSGRGNLSIAQSFSFAGCPNTVQSLWSVNDETTSELMRLFYKNLKDGLPKFKALQEAKREFLKSAPAAHKNPYYWAGFLYFGDLQSLNTHQGYPFLNWCIFGILICGVLIFLLRKAR